MPKRGECMEEDKKELVDRIVDVPHPLINYCDAPGCTVVHSEKENTKPQKAEIVTYKKGVKTVRHRMINEGLDDEQHIIKCEDVYVVGTAVLTRDLDFLPASNMRMQYINGKHIYRFAGVANYSCNCNLLGYVFFRQYFRNKISQAGVVELKEPSLYWKNRSLTHFGHYLLEILSRVWANSIIDFKDLIFLTNEFYDKLTYTRQLLQPFSLENHHVLASDSVIYCRTLYVSSPLLISSAMISKKSLDVYATVRQHFYTGIGELPSKIYFSRKAIKQHSITNEDEVEKSFQKRGFKIIYRPGH